MNISKINIIILFLLYFNNLTAQDSLYLITSITGPSVENAIVGVSGLGDINGDGYDDFCLRFNSNFFDIYLGSDSLNTRNKIRINQSELTYINLVIPIEDINNDGFDDLYFTGQIGLIFPETKGYLFLGNSSIDTLNFFEVKFPGMPKSSGDMNGDGYKDFITINPCNFDIPTGKTIQSDSVGYVYLHLGSDTISFIPNVTFLSGEFWDGYGYNADLSSDINGDGYNDLLVIAPFTSSTDTYPKCYLYLGASTIKNEPKLFFEIPFQGNLTNVFEGNPTIVGDVNSDGFSDFIISGTSFHRLYFGAENFNAEEYIDFHVYSGGATAGRGGDINNDGYNDLIFGAMNHKNSDGVMVGGASVFLGSARPDTLPDFIMEGETKWSHFGRLLGSLGDVNKDGYDEIYVLADEYPDNDNPLGKAYIYSLRKFLVSVEEDRQKKTTYSFNLSQNYPNPFNPSTTISYQIKETGNVRIKIYDALGREITTLVNEVKQPGKYSVTFNADNHSSGIYFVRMQANEYSATRKIILAK